MSPDSNSPERIMQFAWGFAASLTIGVAIGERIFDFLDSAPRTVQEVAEYAKGSVRGWRAVMNCLVGLNLLAKDNIGYRTTPESSTFLVTTKANYIGGFFKHVSKELIPSWLNLEEVVRTGNPADRPDLQLVPDDFFAQY